MSIISDLARNVGFRGTGQRRFAEPNAIRTLPTIDNGSPQRSKNVTTSIDCYVSGQYLQRTGKVIEVSQRYTIFIKYTAETQVATMKQLRDRIMSDFQERYGTSFNITTVHVPDIPAAPEVLPVDDMQMYGGSTLFREMTRYEKYRYDVGTEKAKERYNVESIRKRYGYKR